MFSLEIAGTKVRGPPSESPWRNGTTHVIFEPLDFVARLVALVPKPRVNAYTQTEKLPLLQLASVTGMWGIGFVLYWLASTLNNAWDSDTGRPAKLRVVGVYSTVLVTVILSGSLRLTLAPPVGETMRVAMVTPPEIVDPTSPDGLRFIQTVPVIEQPFTQGPVRCCPGCAC